MNPELLSNLALYLTVFWIFGAAVGGFVVYARFKFAAAFAKRLSGDSESPRSPWLNDEHKYVIVIALAILLGIIVIVTPTYLYNKSVRTMQIAEAKMMLEKGYTYVPSRLAGWEQIKHNEDPDNASPCEAMDAQKTVSKRIEEQN